MLRFSPLLACAFAFAGCVVQRASKDSDTDAGQPTPPFTGDGGALDQGRLIDAARPTDADLSPDAAEVCGSPDPRLPGCVDDTDCVPGEECAIDPHHCRPTQCMCQGESLWDCVGTPPDGSDCALRSACSPKVVECVGDFDCPDGFCDAGLCRRICLGQFQTGACGAEPTPCAIGQTSIPSNGCWACVDARTCVDPGLSNACAGTTTDGAGQCRAADGTISPEHCCRFNFGALSDRARAARCSLDGAPALRVELSADENIEWSCDLVPQTPTLRLWLRNGLPEREQVVALGPESGAGFAELCVAVDQCEAPLSARLLRTGGFGDDFEGRVEITWLDGSLTQSVVRFSICSTPTPGCQ